MTGSDVIAVLFWAIFILALVVSLAAGGDDPDGN